MDYFKDVVTELIAPLVKKTPICMCSNAKCKKQLAKAKKNQDQDPQAYEKLKLQKEPALIHMIKVAVHKEAASKASTEIAQAGTIVPAPDYEWKCPICGKVYVLDHSGPFLKFKPLSLVDRIIDFE